MRLHDPDMDNLMLREKLANRGILLPLPMIVVINPHHFDPGSITEDPHIFEILNAGFLPGHGDSD